MVDIYVDEKARLSGTGRKLVQVSVVEITLLTTFMPTTAAPQFLLQHRVEPTKLAVPSQEQILGTFTRREELVNGRYYMYLERKNGGRRDGSRGGLILPVCLCFFCRGKCDGGR